MVTDRAAAPEGREAARKAAIARADERAAALASIIADIRASGNTTPYTIAADLTPTRHSHGAGPPILGRKCAMCLSVWIGWRDRQPKRASDGLDGNNHGGYLRVEGGHNGRVSCVQLTSASR
jgi:hypothetical protein